MHIEVASLFFFCSLNLRCRTPPRLHQFISASILFRSHHRAHLQYRVILYFSFNCAVSLSAASSAAHLAQHIQDIPNFPPPFSLLSAVPSVFLEDSVRHRSIICLAADAHIDRHNAFMVSGDSCLHMLLDRDTFTSLGLTGSMCKFDEHRWSCSLDLKSINSSAIERARNCLQRCPPVPWVCCSQTDSVQELLRMQPPVSNPIHVALTQFHTHTTQLSSGSNVSCRCSVQVTEYVGCQPVFENDSWLEAVVTGDKELQLELLEWVGAVHAECAGLMSLDSDGCIGLALTSHQPCTLHQIRVEGLLAPCSIISVVSSLADAVCSAVLPWALLTLFGHEDSPSAWKNSQHSGALNGGECHVSVLLFRNSASQVMAILFESVGAADSRV